VFDLKQFIGTIRSIRKGFVECKELNAISESCRIKLINFESSGLWVPKTEKEFLKQNKVKEVPAFPSDYIYDLENGDEHFSDKEMNEFLLELCKEKLISDDDAAQRFLDSVLLIRESASKYKNPKGLILPNSEFSILLALFKVAFDSKALGNVEFKDKKYELSLICYRRAINYCRVILGFISNGEYTCRQQFNHTRGEFMDYGLQEDSDDDEAMELGPGSEHGWYEEEEGDDDDDDDDEDDDDDDDDDEDNDDEDNDDDDDDDDDDDLLWADNIWIT